MTLSGEGGEETLSKSLFFGKHWGAKDHAPPSRWEQSGVSLVSASRTLATPPGPG